ncbi:MAG: ABC transporter transmembrane domain-containing protein, partial [Pseudomonadota bacterium]
FDLNEINSLRTLLFKLDFRTTLGNTQNTVLRSEFLPCFLLDTDNRLFVVRSVDDDGTYMVFDPETNQLDPRARASLNGMLIFPEAKPSATAQGAAAKWTQLAFKAFGRDLKMIFLVSFLTNMFMLAVPLYIMNVYDKAVGTGSADVLIWLTVGLLLVIGADQILKGIRARLQARLAARLDHQASTAIFQQLLFLPLQFVENSPIGSQITRIRQMSAFRDAFTGALVSAIFDLPFLLLFLFAIGVVAGPIIFIPLALIAMFAVLAAWAVPANRQTSIEIGQAKTAQQNISLEMIDNHNLIQNLGCEAIWLERYREASARVAAGTLKMRQFNLFTESVAQALMTISGVATLTIGTIMVVNGSLSQGALIACMALAWKVLNPIKAMFLTGMTLGQTLQSFTQIDRLMAIKTERAPEKAPSISHDFGGRIDFDRVAFRYGNKREPALRQVSFGVQPGEFVVICGPSGAGKSTIVKLLLGLYQQQSGSIRVDGINLRQVDLGSWRQSIGTALEVSHFYHGTISQNIRLSYPQATDEDLDAIALRFGLNAYYGDTLPKGLDTPMNARNTARWSDALKTRISLCRAFIKADAIRILDNPADTLDAEGEEALKAELLRAQGKSTIIMTSHRPSLMRMADKVLWIDDGTVAGFDTPDEIVPKFLAAYSMGAAPKTAQTGS